jgi:starch synthase
VYVVMVASECAPAVKAGGLGDMVSGLARELEIRGNAVEVILPKYATLRYPSIWDLQPSYRDLWVPWHGEAVRCTVWFGHANGRKCFFIEPHSAPGFFGRDRLYGYPDDAERFAFFSKAALEFMLQANKRPDIIHCHDWQAGLVPVLLREQYAQAMPGQRVCYTIHNFHHQGTSDEHVLWTTGLGRPDYFLDADRLGDDFRYRGLNPMKGGPTRRCTATARPGSAAPSKSTRKNSAASLTVSTTTPGTPRRTPSSALTTRLAPSSKNIMAPMHSGTGSGCARPAAPSSRT